MSVSDILDVSSRILPREMAYSLDKYGRIKPCFNNYCFGNFDFVGRISASLNDGDFQIGDDKFVSYYSDDEDDKRVLLEYASSEHGITCDCCNSARDRLTGFVFRANKDSKIVRYLDDNDTVAYRVEDGDYVVDEAVNESLVRDVHKDDIVEIGTSCVGNITGVDGYNLDRLYKKQIFANRVSDMTETEAVSVLSQQYKAVDVKLYVACVIATMKSELGELPNGLGDYSRHKTINCDKILHRLIDTNRTPGNLVRGLDSSITKTAYNMYKNMYVKPNANYFKIAEYAGFDPKSDEIQQLTDEIFDVIKDDELFKDNSVISHNMEVALAHTAAPRSACEAITRLVSHVGLERGDLDFSLSESPKHRDFRLKFNDKKIITVEDKFDELCDYLPSHIESMFDGKAKCHSLRDIYDALPDTVTRYNMLRRDVYDYGKYLVTPICDFYDYVSEDGFVMSERTPIPVRHYNDLPVTSCSIDFSRFSKHMADKSFKSYVCKFDDVLYTFDNKNMCCGFKNRDFSVNLAEGELTVGRSVSSVRYKVECGALVDHLLNGDELLFSGLPFVDGKKDLRLCLCPVESKDPSKSLPSLRLASSFTPKYKDMSAGRNTVDVSALYSQTYSDVCSAFMSLIKDDVAATFYSDGRKQIIDGINAGFVSEQEHVLDCLNTAFSNTKTYFESQCASLQEKYPNASNGSTFKVCVRADALSKCNSDSSKSVLFYHDSLKNKHLLFIPNSSINVRDDYAFIRFDPHKQYTRLDYVLNEQSNSGEYSVSKKQSCSGRDMEAFMLDTYCCDDAFVNQHNCVVDFRRHTFCRFDRKSESDIKNICTQRILDDMYGKYCLSNVLCQDLCDDVYGSVFENYFKATYDDIVDKVPEFSNESLELSSLFERNPEFYTKCDSKIACAFFERLGSKTIKQQNAVVINRVLDRLFDNGFTYNESRLSVDESIHTNSCLAKSKMQDAFVSHMDSELKSLLEPSIQSQMTQYSKLCSMLDKSVDANDVSKSEVISCKLD